MQDLVTFPDKIAVNQSKGAANAGGYTRQVNEGAESAGARAETALTSRAVSHSLNGDSTALGTVTRAS